MNPYFRNPGILLQHSPMRRLAGKQEPNEKKCHLHTVAIHPSIVVRAWVLTHLVKFSAGALWNSDAYWALFWEYQNLGFWKYERDFRFGNYLVRSYGYHWDHLGTTLVTSLGKQVGHEIWVRSFGNIRGSPSRPSWYHKLATRLLIDGMQGFQ